MQWRRGARHHTDVRHHMNNVRQIATDGMAETDSGKTHVAPVLRLTTVFACEDGKWPTRRDQTENFLNEKIVSRCSKIVD